MAPIKDSHLVSTRSGVIPHHEARRHGKRDATFPPEDQAMPVKGAFPINRAMLKVQIVVLALGAGFSLISLVFDYRSFFASGGHILQASACAVANPIMTPCFYGALAFLAALVWAVAIPRSAPEILLGRQHRLQWLLAAGTVFAWSNFAYELYLFIQPQPVTPAFSCQKSVAAINPLMTPCFYGALIFLAALVTSILILRTNR